MIELNRKNWLIISFVMTSQSCHWKTTNIPITISGLQQLVGTRQLVNLNTKTRVLMKQYYSYSYYELCTVFVNIFRLFQSTLNELNPIQRTLRYSEYCTSFDRIYFAFGVHINCVSTVSPTNHQWNVRT